VNSLAKGTKKTIDRLTQISVLDSTLLFARQAKGTNNRATTVLRMAATTLRESDSYLGAQFRRFRTRLGPPVATKAMAAKLARLVYRMLRYGMKYVDQGAELYEAQHRKQQVIHLKRKAAQLGLEIIEVAAAA
jgi:transposase